MAKIATNVSESVYQITNWLGVNQAIEGDARLKHGEASEMRNFKVTSGGALQKRGGSRNVAGLMQEYTVSVDETVETMTFKGLAGALTMYPRVVPNSVGIPIGDGDPVSVDESNWGNYIGYYYSGPGGARQLIKCAVTKATGQIAVNGGAANKGSLTRFAVGTENNVGGVTTTGTQAITTAEQLNDNGGIYTLSGTETEQGRAFSTSAGFKTTDVGGYVLVDGLPWLYYGAKTERYDVSHMKKKYSCTRTSTTQYYTYYTQRTLHIGHQSGQTSGYSGMSFNSATGTFSTYGSSVTVGDGAYGTAYSGGGSSIAYGVGAAEGYELYYASAQGPFTGATTVTTYELGDYIQDILVADGSNPEAGSGYTYVTTQTFDGVSYVIMKSGDSYFAYCASEDTSDYYECEYGWYGYPLTVISNQYDWTFYTTSSTGNGSDSEVRGIWSGYVAKREVLCAACNGYLWELFDEDGVWSKVSCGTMDTSQNVHMFGFDEKLYILNGSEYKVWDGTTLTDVTGYRPMVATEVLPTGGGTALEQVNKLTGARRCRISPDGTATTFQLPETSIFTLDYVTNVATGTAITEYSADLSAGTVTFTDAPAEGVSSIEIGWTMPVDYADTVRSMHYAELYNGAQDTRVFLYGDGSNQCFYSGLDYVGQPRADYFPDLNVIHIGDANTPITAMIRHYNKLLAFKLDSCYSIYYDTLTQEDGKVIPGFYITTVNRDIGNCAPGQARLVENRPRTLDGRSVIEWKATSTSGNITGDQRNAQRVSQRVERSIRTFDLSQARTFYDKISHEFYVIGREGTALVNNVEADAWYVYTGLNATCMITYKDENYYGTSDGWLRHFSNDYTDDQGEAIDAYWESGAMAFGADFRRKYSAMLWVGIKPEDNGYLKVTAETDQKSEFAEYSFTTESDEAVPEMNRIKLKAKKFTYYKLILANNTTDTTATVVSADIRVRGTGYVR